MGHHAQIVFEYAVMLVSVLNEVTMRHVIVHHIVLDQCPMSATESVTAIGRVVHIAAGHLRCWIGTLGDVFNICLAL